MVQLLVLVESFLYKVVQGFRESMDGYEWMDRAPVNRKLLDLHVTALSSPCCQIECIALCFCEGTPPGIEA